MKATLPSLTERKSKADADWLKTPYPNLIRYRPSGTYFGRVRVNGKLIHPPRLTALVRYALHRIRRGHPDGFTLAGHQDGGALCMKTYGHLRDEANL